MSVDLRNDLGEEFWFNTTGWRYLTEFAEMNGFCWPAHDGSEVETLNSDQARAFAAAIRCGLENRSIAEAADFVSDTLSGRLVVPSEGSIFMDGPIRIETGSIEEWKAFVRFAERSGFNVEY